MPTERIEIIIEGKDKASSALGSIKSGLGGIATVAGGILTAGLLRDVGRGLTSLGAGAIESVGHIQTLEIGLESLIARQKMFKTVTEEVGRGLSDEETFRLRELNTQLESQQARLAELNRERMRDNTPTLVARQHELELQIEKTNREISELNRLSGETETLEKYVATGVDMADALSMAKGETQELLRFVEQLAIVSPFETKDVEMVTKLGLGARFSVDFVDDLTRAFLDYAAGVGITGENLTFAADQFFQIKKIGKITAVDLRQLRRLGIDLAEILGVKMGMSVDEFNDQVQRTPELWDQFFQSFVEFTDETFAGAAQRMSQTIPGMMSTARDLIEVGSRNLFRPMIEALSPALGELVGSLSEFVTGPEMKMIGEGLGSTLSLALAGEFDAAVQEIQGLLLRLGADPQFVAGLGELLIGLRDEFAEFLADMQEVIGPAGILIEDAFVRIGDALGLTSENVSGLDIVLSIFGGTLDAIVVSVEAFAVGMQAVADIVEFVSGKVEKAIEVLEKLNAIAGAGEFELGGRGVMGGTEGTSLAERLFGGQRQFGGPVTANAPYLVGERGPEVFVPNQGGTVVPNGGTQIIQLVVDGKTLAEVVNPHLGRMAARRAGMATL